MQRQQRRGVKNVISKRVSRITRMASARAIIVTYLSISNKRIAHRSHARVMRALATYRASRKQQRRTPYAGAARTRGKYWLISDVTLPRARAIAANSSMLCSAA